jgi:hypothetical protein
MHFAHFFPRPEKLSVGHHQHPPQFFNFSATLKFICKSEKVSKSDFPKWQNGGTEHVVDNIDQHS